MGKQFFFTALSASNTHCKNAVMFVTVLSRLKNSLMQFLILIKRYN
jgi:hypothetical protein